MDICRYTVIVQGKLNRNPIQNDNGHILHSDTTSPYVVRCAFLWATKQSGPAANNSSLLILSVMHSLLFCSLTKEYPNSLFLLLRGIQRFEKSRRRDLDRSSIFLLTDSLCYSSHICMSTERTVKRENYNQVSTELSTSSNHPWVGCPYWTSLVCTKMFVHCIWRVPVDKLLPGYTRRSC